MKIVDIHFPHIHSTNTWAKENLKSFPIDSCLVIRADEQKEGRGRFGRRWISPPKSNLLVTFAFSIGEDKSDALIWTYHLANALLRVLQTYDIHASIKAPNDIFVGQKKLAGILCETFSCYSRIGIAIGLGLNVNMEEKELASIDQGATSLLMETGTRQDVVEVLNRIKREFLKDLGVA